MLTNAELRAYEAHATMCHDVCNHLTKKDWEQRRYEIAKDVFCILLTEKNELTYFQKAENAVLRADALIEELKKKKD